MFYSRGGSVIKTATRDELLGEKETRRIEMDINWFPRWFARTTFTHELALEQSRTWKILEISVLAFIFYLDHFTGDWIKQGQMVTVYSFH